MFMFRALGIYPQSNSFGVRTSNTMDWGSLLYYAGFKFSRQ